MKYAHNGGDVENEDERLSVRATNAKEFEVLVCETAPVFTGHKTANILQQHGLQVSLVTDSSVFSLMSRVDKVMISSTAIMANGGLIAPAGAYNICLAAKVSIFSLNLLTLYLLSYRNTQFP